jgi:hypothetical protein
LGAPVQALCDITERELDVMSPDWREALRRTDAASSG